MKDVMTDDQILKTVQEKFGQLLRVPAADITPDKSLRDDLNVDSMFMVESSMSLEEAFDIEVPEVDAPQWQTIADVVAYVAEKRASRQ